MGMGRLEVMRINDSQLSHQNLYEDSSLPARRALLSHLRIVPTSEGPEQGEGDDD